MNSSNQRSAAFPAQSSQSMPSTQSDPPANSSAGGPDEIVPTGGVRPNPESYRTEEDRTENADPHQIAPIDDTEELPEGSDAPQDPDEADAQQKPAQDGVKPATDQGERRPSSDSDLPQPARG